MLYVDKKKSWRFVNFFILLNAIFYVILQTKYNLLFNSQTADDAL